MKPRIVLAVVLCLAAVAVLALAAAPAQAVVGGTQDAANKYANVGMNLERDWYVPGEWAFAGSCTLIKNDRTGSVVVTAAHCLWGETSEYIAQHWVVTFDPLTKYDWFMSVPDLQGVATYQVTAAVMYPGFVMSQLHNSAPSFLVQNDVGLMWLDGPVYVPGTKKLVAPAPIVGLGGLDALDLKGEPFTVVGYGVSDMLGGSVMSAVAGGYAAPVWNGRNYKEVAVNTEDGQFADRYLSLTGGMYLWDSGGAVFHGDTLVGVNSNGISPASPSDAYRLDSPVAQQFLSSYGLVPRPPQ